MILNHRLPPLPPAARSSAPPPAPRSSLGGTAFVAWRRGGGVTLSRISPDPEVMLYRGQRNSGYLVAQPNRRDFIVAAHQELIRMWEDPIVKETRAAREELVAQFGGDLNALWEHLQKTQEHYRDRVFTGQPKSPAATGRKVS